MIWDSEGQHPRKGSDLEVHRASQKTMHLQNISASETGMIGSQKKNALDTLAKKRKVLPGERYQHYQHFRLYIISKSIVKYRCWCVYTHTGGDIIKNKTNIIVEKHNRKKSTVVVIRWSLQNNKAWGNQWHKMHVEKFSREMKIIKRAKWEFYS